MILNLPLDAIVVNFGEAKKAKQQMKGQYRIVKAPANIEGVRRKRKLLEQVKASDNLNLMRFEILEIL